MANSLTTEQLHEIIRLATVEDFTQRQIANAIGSAKSTIGDFLLRKTYKEFWEEYDKKPVASAITVKPEHRRQRLSGKRFLFTCAQNNTYVNMRFFQSIQQFIKHRDCQLLVGRSYYNQSGFQNLTVDAEDSNDDVWFDPKIRPYIMAETCLVTDHLLWLGDLNVIPTAVRPLSGFHNYTKKESGIIPHCKVNLESLPTHKDDPDKFLYTTGSITYPNFIQKKAGQKAEFHHIFGALYVEIDDDGVWHARHIQAESTTGNFYDLHEYFTPDGVQDQLGESVEAINWGDLHIEKLDADVAETSFGVKVIRGRDGQVSFERASHEDSILDVLRPRYQFCHDTTDFMPRNHHNIADPHFRFKMYTTKQETVAESLKQCADCISAMSREFVSTVVVESNHDLALVRWLKTADYRTDPANAVFFLSTQLKMYMNMLNENHDYNVFADVMRELNDTLYYDDVTFLNTDESFRLFGKDGIECGWHGHNGNNGARGSTIGYTRVGIRANIGHQHSAAILEGVYVAGHCMDYSLVGYTSGPSSWSHSHIITYRNGKRAIITVKDGKKWRA